MISRSLLRQLPARVTTGAYVLNSGLGKLHADQQAAESMHGYFDEVVKPLLLEDDGVVWLGEADHERKLALLAAAGCLLFPIQWEEPFGLVMAEALACGTPVVALRRGSVPEVVTHGETGWVCDDLEELAGALGRVGSLSPARCRADAEQRFNVSLMAQRYESVYRSVVGRATGSDGRGLQLVSGR